MKRLDEFIETAESNLNDALRHFEESPNALAQEFVELKLQACIFQYDVCAEMVGVIRNNPQGFACSVALKGLVLRLFEYDRTLNKHWIPRLLKLANSRAIPIDRIGIKELRKRWKTELGALNDWHQVRNEAAGHYSHDVSRQVALLKSLSVDGVMSVVRGFLSFNMELLVLLKNAGRGVVVDGDAAGPPKAPASPLPSPG